MSWSTTLKNRQFIRSQLDAGEEIAVMFSDIRGFTHYTAVQGDHAAWRLAQLHETLMRNEIEAHNGILVKTLGDGIMAAFGEPRDGVAAAVAIQRAIRERNNTANNLPIDVGIGVASGTPVMTETDLFGHSVNTAQRLSALAKGGQILVTERIRQIVPLRDELRYIPLGRRELKGVGEEEVFEVVWIHEAFRISDARDRITIVLTVHGTVVVELAKRWSREERVSRGGWWRIPFFRRRSPARPAGVNREYPVTDVRADLHGTTLVLHLGKRTVHLRGVDPDRAHEFIARLASAVDHEADVRSSRGESS